MNECKCIDRLSSKWRIMYFLDYVFVILVSIYQWECITSIRILQYHTIPYKSYPFRWIITFRTAFMNSFSRLLLNLLSYLWATWENMYSFTLNEQFASIIFMHFNDFLFITIKPNSLRKFLLHSIEKSKRVNFQVLPWNKKTWK